MSSKLWFINKIVALRHKRIAKLFTKIKLITSRSKWTGPYNNERMKYNKIR